MAINGISSGSYFNYSSSVNQIKLQQALSKNLSRTESSREETAYNKSAQLKDSLSFLKDYNSSMTDLMSSANKLRDTNAAGVFKDLSVESSNADVLSATKNYNLRGSSGNSYEVTVEQLAAAQQNVSSALTSSAKASADASFDIITSGANISVNVSKDTVDGIGKTNKQILQEAAGQINAQKAGITASVVEKDGKSMLQLTGQTGEKNAFIVSGEFADAAGMTNATQEAQNAQYSVAANGGAAKEYSAASNSVSLEYGKVSAVLKKTGSSTISIGADHSKVISAVDDLVKNYNQTLKVLNDNAERGKGVTNQLRSMLSGMESDKALDQAGISIQKDGTLKLDKDKLAANLKKDPKLTQDIVAGSFGIAQGAYQKSVTGLQASNTSLISNDIVDMNEQHMNDPINALSLYSKGGAYNLMNYAMSGMLFNMYA